jgi:hypothetical protein
MRIYASILRRIPEPSIKLFLLLSAFSAIVAMSVAMLDH